MQPGSPLALGGLPASTSPGKLHRAAGEGTEAPALEPRECCPCPADTPVLLSVFSSPPGGAGVGALGAWEGVPA